MADRIITNIVEDVPERDGLAKTIDVDIFFSCLLREWKDYVYGSKTELMLQIKGGKELVVFRHLSQ